MHNKITRRKFIKRIVFVGSAIGAMTILGASGKVALDRRRIRNKKPVRSRKENSKSWFTSREYALVGSLAALIVPSDETGPGALDTEVVNTIDSMVSKSQSRQTLYTKGLKAFDEAAQHKYNLPFIKLTYEQQIDLLKLVDRVHEELILRDYSLLNRINRKFKYYKYTKWDGLGATTDMFPTLVKDVIQSFYTTQVAWDWLGYDGPPQPIGYIGEVSECA